MSDTSRLEGPQLRPVADVRRFATFRAISALLLREMSSTYGKTPLGYLWAVLEPVGGIALLTLIFSAGFKTPPLGTSFPIFYASGLLLYMMFLDLNTKMMTALTFSRSLLVYPRVTFADAILARFLLSVMTQLLVSYIVLVGVLSLTDHRTAPDLPMIALAFLMTAALGLGVGALNAFLAGVMPAWQRVWAIINRPMIILSGVILLYDNLPSAFQAILWYNPLIHVMGVSRAGFYPYYAADYVSLTYVFGVAMGCFVVGFLLLRRYGRWILQTF